jgi:hypothetical protein
MDNKKIKFFDGLSREINNSQTYMDVTNESFLLMPEINSKKKTNIKLNDRIHPKDFNVSLKSEKEKEKDNKMFTYGNDFGPGRGFGNPNISNDIRNGQSTRLDNNDFFKHQESILNERTDYITRNYQNPNNLILPFPRGGELTRKSIKEDSNKINNFDFRY